MLEFSAELNGRIARNVETPDGSGIIQSGMAAPRSPGNVTQSFIGQLLTTLPNFASEVR
jgi:hypothetical protein